MLLEEMVLRKQVELLGGGFYAPILPLIPGPDRLGQVELLTTYIRRSFGKRPRGCWLPDYAWEPGLASSLQSCGFDYTFLTEKHFRIAGADPRGPRSAADDRRPGQEPPGFSGLRRLESFPSPMPIVEARRPRVEGRRAARSIPFSFPGEAARDLWAASKLESPDVFFERSASRHSSARRSGSRPRRPRASSRARAISPGPTSPAAPRPSSWNGACRSSLRISGLSLEEGSGQERFRQVRGYPSAAIGSPRRLLLRHEESLALYAKMHYVRILVSQLRGDKSRKKTAQEELWKGQCGGAYWHAPEGGIARLSVRAAAYSALIEAEKITRQRGSFSPGIISADIDFNGAKEIMYQGADLNAYVQLRGACLAELDSFKTRTNYVNVMDLGGRGLAGSAFAIIFPRKAPSGEDRGNSRMPAMPSSTPSGRRASPRSFARARPISEAGNASSQSGRPILSGRAGLSVDYEISNREASPLSLRIGVEFNLAAGFSAESVALLASGPERKSGSRPGTSASSPISTDSGSPTSPRTRRIEIRSDLPFDLVHKPIVPEAVRILRPPPIRAATSFSAGTWIYPSRFRAEDIDNASSCGS